MSESQELLRPIIGIENRSAQEVFDIMVDRIKSALVPTLPSVQGVKVTEATHRHKKRGTEYVLIGYGKMQAETWFDDAATNGLALGNGVDMREVAIYRSVDDGQLWVRPREEFEDGRFAALATGSGTGVEG